MLRRIVVGIVALAACTTTRDGGNIAGLGLERPRIEVDTVEVVVCRVPFDSTVPLFGGLPLRADLDARDLAERFGEGVADYFAEVSDGRYVARFVAGDDVVLDRGDGYEQCTQRAIDGADSSATVVLAIADAEHAAGLPGGYGSSGRGCGTAVSCPVTQSHRYAYVGASDFSGQWGDAPPLDLVEHELGHTLGWIHSGVDADGSYLSALDVMSDSAAPRKVDPTARHAPDPLAIHRLVAGWLDDDEVRVVDSAATVRLGPSNLPGVDDAVRLVVIATTEYSLITVEVLANSGFDAHLPVTGVAVHRIRLGGAGAIESIDPITSADRPPFVDLVTSGGSLDVDGWHLDVVERDDGTWSITIDTA